MIENSPEKKLLDRLERLYAEQQLPTSSHNACGSCFTCCTARGLTRHAVSELELAYLADRVNPAAADAMRSYVRRERNEAGELRYPVCPHYQEGCTVYPHRPFSCRVFGHFREQGSRLPEGCLLSGSEREFPRGGALSSVPGSSELRELVRELSLYEPAASQAGTVEPGDPHDPLDRALVHVAARRWPEALKELSQGVRESAFALQTLGLVQSSLGDLPAAVRAYARACELAPDSLECLCQLGSTRLFAGEFARGVQDLEAVVARSPEHAAALSMLGSCYTLASDHAGAAHYYERAVRAAPDQPELRLRLASAYLEQQNIAAAREQLEAARAFEATREVAERALLAGGFELV